MVDRIRVNLHLLTQKDLGGISLSIILHQDITRFQVSMNNTWRKNILTVLAPVQECQPCM